MHCTGRYGLPPTLKSPSPSLPLLCYRCPTTHCCAPGDLGACPQGPHQAAGGLCAQVGGQQGKMRCLPGSVLAAIVLGKHEHTCMHAQA